MRRDKDDKRWQEVKKDVSKRDRNSCRLLGKLTAKEYCVLQRYAPSKLLTTLDHAHVFPVSRFPWLVYEKSNIVVLNRYSHHNLDDCCDPILGRRITKEEQEDWWIRIVGEKRYESLKKKAFPESIN